MIKQLSTLTKGWVTREQSNVFRDNPESRKTTPLVIPCQYICPIPYLSTTSAPPTTRKRISVRSAKTPFYPSARTSQCKAQTRTADRWWPTQWSSTWSKPWTPTRRKWTTPVSPSCRSTTTPLRTTNSRRPTKPPNPTPSSTNSHNNRRSSNSWRRLRRFARIAVWSCVPVPGNTWSIRWTNDMWIRI